MKLNIMFFCDIILVAKNAKGTSKVAFGQLAGRNRPGVLKLANVISAGNVEAVSSAAI